MKSDDLERLVKFFRVFYRKESSSHDSQFYGFDMKISSESIENQPG